MVWWCSIVFCMSKPGRVSITRFGDQSRRQTHHPQNDARSRLRNWSTCPIYVRSCSPVVGPGVLYSPPQDTRKACHVRGFFKSDLKSQRNHCIEKAGSNNHLPWHWVWFWIVVLSDIWKNQMRFDSQLCNHMGSQLHRLAPHVYYLKPWYQKFDSHDWAKLGENFSLFSRNPSHVAGDIRSIAAKQKHDMVALILHSIPI